jgi:hypothetical protein
MKKLIFKLSLVAAIALLITSCRKNDTLENKVESFDDVMALNTSPTQVFNLNGGTGGTITGAKGSKITFPPNFARNADGTPFTGPVVAALRESLKKSNWIADGLSTSTSTDPLVSGGMINIDVRRADNGAVLNKSPNVDVTVSVPAIGQPDAAMRLFMPDSATSIQGPTGSLPTTNATNPVLAWQSNPSPFSVTATGYNFTIPKFGWANCDRLYSLPGTKTTIRVVPVLPAGATVVKALLVYKNISTVISLPSSGTGFASYTNSVPVGSTADVVLIARSATGKALFKVVANNVFTAGQVFDITPDEVSGSVVNDYISKL